ncbi:MAG: sodium:proton antiporter, partial [Comamonadaceae bacterium]
MDHHVPLIATIAGGLGLALLLGFVAARLKLPALVGYLVAGVLIGPYTPGFVADVALASELAEIGVMLLMFGVGLHFSLQDLLAVRKLAVPGAIVFGIALSVASTVVLLRALEGLGLLESFNGRAAVGWLVVEDLA